MALGSSRTSTWRLEQRLDDLDPLLHPDRQVFHQGVGRPQAEPLERRHVAARRAPVGRPIEGRPGGGTGARRMERGEAGNRPARAERDVLGQ
jgi:hypothetical protein